MERSIQKIKQERNLFRGVIVCIIASALFIRFYNFSNRINFGPEQALSLIVSAQQIEKPSLLGLPNIQRSTSVGHILYSGSLFNYALAPLLPFFNYDPLPITAFFTLLNVVTGIVVFMIARRFFVNTVALMSLFFFLFNDYMINHSLFIWILNWLPLIGALTFYCLLMFQKTQKHIFIFFVGILTGIGFNLEYMYVWTGLLLLLYCLYSSGNKLRCIEFFLLGAVIGNAPMILFELRNNFYHFRTLVQYSIDTIYHPQQNHIAAYHFFQYWPFLAIIGGIFIDKLYKHNKLLCAVIIAFYLISNLTSNRVSFSDAVGMEKGTNYTTIVRAVKTIKEDLPTNFNVVSLIGNDFRGYVLRYFLKYTYLIAPKDIEEYTTVSNLYVLGQSKYDFRKDPPWEISAVGKTRKKILTDLGNGFVVFKLTKIE